MESKRWLRLLAVFAVVGLVAAACGDDDDTDAGGDTEETTDDTEAEDGAAGGGGPMVIGALLPESGSLSVIIDSLRTPIDMAVEEINAAGGVLGQDVVVAAADDGTDDSTVAAAGFDSLVTSDGATVLLGPASSTLTEALMDDIANNNIVACSGSNTAAGLEDLDDGGHYFGFAPNDNLQGPALAEVIAGDGHTNVAVLVRNDTYGTGFGESIVENLEAAGVTVALDQSYDPNAASFDAEVQAVIDSGADALALIGFNDDGAKVVAGLIEAGVGPDTLPIYTGDGMKSSSFHESVSDDPTAVEGLGGTAPAAAPAGVEHPFIDAFAETGVDTIFSVYFYDCAIATALATEVAGTTDAEAVAAAMLEVTSGGTSCQTYAECKELLDAGEDIDFNGSSGDVDLNENGHVTAGSYDVWAYDATGADATLDVPQIQVSS